MGKRGLWIAIGALTLLGLALRVAAARGGLWLDEAWSAVHAREAGGPIGVFLRINHDNNHVLNSLWLQLAGWGAPPLLARALSITSGAAAIPVAAAIALRRSREAGLIAAPFFALSPILLTYGAEARGYAPMVLAMLVAILLVDRWLANPERPAPWLALTLAGLIGTLAHLTMIFAVVALAGWARITLGKRLPARAAMIATVRLTGGAVLASGGIIALLLLAAAASPSGMQLGGYAPFTISSLLAALDRMAAFTLGLPELLLAPAAATAALLLWRLPGIGARRSLYFLGIFGLPVAILFLHVGNSGFPRYYLLSAVLLLLLAAETLAVLPGRMAVALTIALACGMLVRDGAIITNRRADPAVIVRTLAAEMPKGTTVLLDPPRQSSVVEAAAASAHYPLTWTDQPCARAPWLLIDGDDPSHFPQEAKRCGIRYRPVMERIATGLSGLSWRLYRAAGPIS